MSVREQGAQPMVGRRWRRHPLLVALALLFSLMLLAAACGEDADDVAVEPDEPDEVDEPEDVDEPDDEEPAEEPEDVVDTDDWPSQNITWVVAQEPGGGSETDIRRMQPHLEQILGVPIEVQFRTGADGSIGWSSILDEEPDGHTVSTLVIPQVAVQPQVFDDAGYETGDFTYISGTVMAPSTFLVRHDSPYETLDDLIEDVEARPGGVTFSAVGTLSGSAFAYGQFIEETGLEMTFVPETGGAGGLETSLLGGHIDVAGLNIGHRMRIGDDVRPLAVAALERHELEPDLPTFREEGLDVTASVVWGVFGPPDMPDDIVQRLNDAIREVFEIEEFRESVVSEGLIPLADMSPEEFEEFVYEQQASLEQVLPAMEALE